MTVRAEAPRRRDIAVVLAASALLLAHTLFMCVLGLSGVSAAAQPGTTTVGVAEQSPGESTHRNPVADGHDHACLQGHGQSCLEGHGQACLAMLPQRAAEPEFVATVVDLESADAQAHSPQRPRFAAWGPWRIAAPDGRGILRDLCIDRC